MTRRTFYDILREEKIDLKKEYTRLYDLFHKARPGNYSVYEIINIKFDQVWFRGTSCSLDDFNEEYGFDFVEQPQNFSLDYLITFCEYIYNIIYAVRGNSNITFYVDLNKLEIQIDRLVEKLQYTYAENDDFTIFVPKSPQAMSVAEIVDAKLSYKILEYNHHSLKGDLDAKKAILIKIADELEPQRKELKNIDTQLEKDLFFAFNRFNIRHNNCEPQDVAKYVKEFASLNIEEKEELYDYVYEQSLIAFLKLENKSKKLKFENIKSKIEIKN